MIPYFWQILQVLTICGSLFLLLGVATGCWIWRGNKKVVREMEAIGHRVNGDMREVRKAWRETEQHLFSIQQQSPSKK